MDLRVVVPGPLLLPPPMKGFTVGDTVRPVRYSAAWYYGITEAKVEKIGTKFVHIRAPWGRLFRSLPEDVRHL